MQPLVLPKGTKLAIGAPANPMPKNQSDAIASLVTSIEGISEAHLPQCFFSGVMENAAQVLIFSIDRQRDPTEVVNAIGAGLSKALTDGKHLDILPVPADGQLMQMARDANCQIYPPPRGRPWWKFWQ